MILVRGALAAGLGLTVVAALLQAPAAQAAEDGPHRLALIVPIVAPASTEGLIPAAELERYTSDGGSLDRQLDAVFGARVTLGIDPKIIASIRVLGTSAPESAVTWLQRLRVAGNETFALGYADLDLSLVTQAGGILPFDPQGFGFALDPTQFAPEPAETPTASPTAEPSTPTLPRDEEVIAWPYTHAGIAWPRAGTVTADDLEKLSGAGYQTTILSSGNLDNGAAARAEVSGASVLVTDDAVSAALRDAAGGIADPSIVLSAIAAAGDGDLVVATTGRGASPNAEGIGRVIAELESSPGVTLVPLGEALAEGRAGATLVDSPQSEERVARAKAMLQAESEVRSFATIAANPDAIRAERRLSLLAALSNDWAPSTARWSQASTDYLGESRALRESVQVAQISSLLLVADNDQYLPVSVDNALDQPVTVYLTLRPRTAVLRVLDAGVEVVVPARSQARVDVPVESLANGTVAFVASLTSASGQTIGSAVSGEVNVQAGWETPIVIVVAAIVVLIFGFGIVRTVIRRRRSRSRDD